MDRAPRLLGRATVIGLSAALLIFSVRGIGLEDTEAYWNAAMRLREGQPLYPDLGGIEAQFTGSTYVYSPWFAFAWMPLTYLPHPLAIGLWVGALSIAGAWLVWQLRERWWAALFLGVLIFDSISEGNVQTLLVAGVVWGIERRSGPVWIALAASLKAFPLLLVLVYVRRREWTRVAWTVLLTILFTLPTWFFDLSHYPFTTSRAPLFGPLWIPVALGLIAYAALWVPRTWDRLAAAAAVIAVMPRFWMYDLTWLAVGLADRVGADRVPVRASRDAVEP